MIQYQLKYILLFSFLTLFLFQEGKAQLIITGLVEDPERSEQTSSQKNTQLKIAATTYTDTLRLPFFEDFTDVVMPVDSIIIVNTTDSIVRVYDNTLNNYPDGTTIYIGFWSAVANTTTTKLSRKLWYIKKISPNIYTIDSSAAMTTPMKIDVNVVVKDAFWRFSKRVYSATLDTLKWVSGGNTYVNNRYPSEPVSYNVATFDGLKSDGVPYSTTNVLAKGFSDNLTSLPINLKSYTAGDNIYLSYFWQHSGIGDTPESDDYLQLEFKDSTGTWNVIQTIAGNLTYMSNFKINLAPVLDPIYFSRHFQFRFRSYGRLSGPFDIWNLDNIYLNKNRSAVDTLTDDKAIGNLPVTFLTDYTAMPYNQYFADKAGHSGDMNFNNSNLGRGIASQQFYYTVADYTVQPDNVLFSRDTAATHSPDIPVGDNQRTFYDVCTPDINLLNNYGHAIYIDQTYRIPTNDTLNILFTNNNKYNTRTVLWDYYAYDDDSPEWGIGANQTGAKVANMFTLQLSDTITDIDIYFTRSKGPNMNGRSILLSVWDQNKNLVSQQTAQVGYGGFKRYKLNTPVIVPAGADYYVGYQQNFVDLLSVGYDKNYDHSDKVVFSLSSNVWDVYSQQPGYVTGSMMIRPVFSKGEILVLSVGKEEEETLSAILFPVPANDVLKIQGKIGEITLYDFTGRVIASKSFNPMDEEKEISTSALSNGFYIAELRLNDKVLIKKLIVQH